MKPIDDTKICQTRKPTANDNSLEHDQVAAAYLARIFREGSAADRASLFQWGRLTTHWAKMGGVAESRFMQWVDDSIRQLAVVEEASGIAKGAKKTAKAIGERRDAVQSDIDSLEQSIAELQANLSECQQALAGIEAEQKQIDEAVALIEQTEGSAERGGVLGLAWTFARDNKHPFE